jgi:hypothetical protein
MKVLLRYSPQDDEDEELETSFSLTLPKAWLNGPTEKLRHLFVDQFNKKHAGAEGVLPMNKADCRLETKLNEILSDETSIEQCIKDGDELFLRRGKTASSSSATTTTTTSGTTSKRKTEGDVPAAPTSQTTSQNATAAATTSNGSVPCKRFGCGKRFVPGQPSSEPCRHHKKPPVFHETRKYWACCPDKVAWDWDSFQAIQGCEELPEHSNVSDTTKKVMGGTELRAEINGPREIATEKKLTGLDKLMGLRQSLVNIGVSGDLFDAARDSIKRVHEDVEGKNVWDKICSELSNVFEGALNSAKKE